MPMNLQKDLKEFIELLNELEVHFLIVGAFAVAFSQLSSIYGGHSSVR